MEDIVNPGILSISTHLEKGGSVISKSANFGFDEGE